MLIRLFSISICLLFSVVSYAQIESNKSQEGFQTFEMESGDSTFLMKQYFMVFLRKGEIRNQDEKEAAEIQKAHLDHLSKLAKANKICIVGPFGDDGDIRGIAIYNTKTQEEARQLASEDPAVKAGRLKIEIHPFWAAVGSQLF